MADPGDAPPRRLQGEPIAVLVVDDDAGPGGESAGVDAVGLRLAAERGVRDEGAQGVAGQERPGGDQQRNQCRTHSGPRLKKGRLKKGQVNY
jgi:hypothetical protein